MIFVRKFDAWVWVVWQAFWMPGVCQDEGDGEEWDCNKIGFNLLVGISVRIWHDGSPYVMA